MNKYKKMMEPIQMDAQMKQDILQEVQRKTEGKQPRRFPMPGMKWAGVMLSVLVAGWLGLGLIRPFFSCSSNPSSASPAADFSTTAQQDDASFDTADNGQELDEALAEESYQEESDTDSLDTGGLAGEMPVVFVPLEAVDLLLQEPVLQSTISHLHEDTILVRWEGASQSLQMEQIDEEAAGSLDTSELIRLFAQYFPELAQESLSSLQIQETAILLDQKDNEGFRRSFLMVQGYPVILTASTPVSVQDWQKALQIIVETS